MSKTEIFTYLQCPMKYKYLYIDKMKYDMPEIAMDGIIIHDAYEQFFPAINIKHLKELVTEREIYEYFLETFKKIIPKRVDDPMIKNFCMMETTRLMEIREMGLDVYEYWYPVACELYFKDEDIRLKGKIDRIDRAYDGSLHPTEYKTGHAPKDGKLIGDTKKQLALYSIAMEKQFKEPVKFICCVYPRDNVVLFEPLQKVTKTYALKSRDKVISAIERGEFSPKPGYNCFTRQLKDGRWMEGCPCFEQCRKDNDIDFNV
ncbi:MAG: RecB family exonuclease [Promethearchaeota archaeon]